MKTMITRILNLFTVEKPPVFLAVSDREAIISDWAAVSGDYTTVMPVRNMS